MRNSHSSGFASGLWRRGLSHPLRLHKRVSCEIDAQPVLSSPANPRLGIDAASQVVMKVGAFRHSPHKRFNVERVRTGCLKGTGGALLASPLRAGTGYGRGGLSKQRAREASKRQDRGNPKLEISVHDIFLRTAALARP